MHFLVFLSPVSSVGGTIQGFPLLGLFGFVFSIFFRVCIPVFLYAFISSVCCILTTAQEYPRAVFLLVHGGPLRIQSITFSLIIFPPSWVCAWFLTTGEFFWYCYRKRVPSVVNQMASRSNFVTSYSLVRIVLLRLL